MDPLPRLTGCLLSPGAVVIVYTAPPGVVTVALATSDTARTVGPAAGRSKNLDVAHRLFYTAAVAGSARWSNHLC